MPQRPAVDRGTTRKRAERAWSRGLAALALDGAASQGQILWLSRQRPVAIDDHGFIRVAYPTEEEARDALAREGMVRLANRVRDEGIASGICSTVAPAPKESSVAAAAAKRPPRDRRRLFMPGFLVKTTLPHTDPEASEFTRVNGDVRTTLHAPARIGLPFGVYARLILIHVTTRAVLRQCRTLPLGRSKNSFLAQIGLSNSGGGSQSTLAREQLARLCATTFTTTYGSRYERGHNLSVADEWLKQTEDGLMIVLSERFFHLATKSAVPIYADVLQELRRSPLAIDTYAWLTHRLDRLEAPVAIPWAKVERQFGSGYSRPRQFRWKFRQALGRVLQAWPGGPQVDLEAKRVVLHPGPTSVPTYIERSNAKAA